MVRWIGNRRSADAVFTSNNVLLGMLIAAAGLAVVAIAYYNRNQLSDRSRRRVLLAHIGSVVLGVAVVVVVATDQPTLGPAARPFR